MKEFLFAIVLNSEDHDFLSDRFCGGSHVFQSDDSGIKATVNFRNASAYFQGLFESPFVMAHVHFKEDLSEFRAFELFQTFARELGFHGSSNDIVLLDDRYLKYWNERLLNYDCV